MRSNCPYPNTLAYDTGILGAKFRVILLFDGLPCKDLQIQNVQACQRRMDGLMSFSLGIGAKKMLTASIGVWIRLTDSSFCTDNRYTTV